MQIHSINQALKQVYSHIKKDLNMDLELIEKLQGIEEDTMSTLMDMGSGYGIDSEFIDENINAAIVAHGLNLEPSLENLQYIKRLGFSLSAGIERLLNSEHLEGDILSSREMAKLLLAPQDIKDLLIDFREKDLLDMADRIDQLLAFTRARNEEYMDLSMRLFVDPNSGEELQYELDQIIEILSELNLETTSETIGFVDKFLFVFGEDIPDALQVSALLQNYESTSELENLMENPEEFIEFFRDIHSYERLMDMEKGQKIYDRLAMAMKQIQRYIKTFTVDRRDIVSNFLKDEIQNFRQLIDDILIADEILREEILDLFESTFQTIEDNNIEALIHTKIEADISKILQQQIGEEFPFWLLPIISQLENNPIYGELWIKKDVSQSNDMERPYVLSLYSDMKNLGRIDICIYGLGQNIDVYILSDSSAKDLIFRHKKYIIDILRSFNFSIGRLDVLEHRVRGTVLSYMLTKSLDTNRDIDIKI